MSITPITVLDGQLELGIHKRSLRTFILSSRIIKAFKDIKFDDIEDILHSNFIVFLSRTAYVKSLTNDLDETAIAWLSFWDRAQNRTDYPALFELYLTELDLPHNNAWDTAINEASVNPFKVDRVLGNPDNLTEEERNDSFLENSAKNDVLESEVA